MADDPHRISLEDAARLVAGARKASTLEIKGWRFDAAIIREILDQPGVTGIRMYMARTDEGQPTLVLVGTDAEGRDRAAGTIAEEGQPCPPECDDKSPFFAP